jgi:hypothetical protein
MATTFRLTIAAFGDDDRQQLLEEVTRILRDVAVRTTDGDDSGSLYDSNGNRVGRFDLMEGK